MAETHTLRVWDGRVSLDSLDLELSMAKARVVLDTATQRAEATDTATLRPAPALTRNVAVLAFRVDSTKQALAHDSIRGGTREGATQATMKRIGELMSRAITRGGGLVYTILLAVTYLPAALVLMERAWELSFVAPSVADKTATGRQEWRVKQGVGFTLGDQWTRILAVLSPVLASGSAVALAEIYKLITG